MGLKGKTPKGGHMPPNSTAGANLLWKNAQKNLTKKVMYFKIFYV